MFRAEPVPERSVRCYHCGKDVHVPAAARSAACPVCYRGLTLDDLRVREAGMGAKLSTCGRIVIERKAKASSRSVSAGDGLELHGTLEGNVTSYGTVVLGSRAKLKGDLVAPALVMEEGAVIEGGFLQIGVAGSGPL